MSRSLPEYRRHPNGSAFVQHKSIPTKSHRMHLGPHGSEISKQRYAEFIAQLQAAEKKGVPPILARAGGITIGELVEQYLAHAETYYTGEPDKTAPEVFVIWAGCAKLIELFGSTRAADFGPLKLNEVRQAYITKGIARTTINGYVSRIKRMFKWATAQELVPRDAYHGLQAVDGLRPGRTTARESKKIRPVPLDTVLATLPFCSPTIAAMIRVQFWCGMRPQDVCGLRPCDLDRSRAIWLYRPFKHKNTHRGKTLIKAIVPQAQAILSPLLECCGSQDCVFKPQAKPGAGRRFKTHSYCDAIHVACDRAFMPSPPLGIDRESGETVVKWHRRLTPEQRAELKKHNKRHRWSPNQLRHAIATMVAESLGHSAASAWLGHDRPDTTLIYIEKQATELLQLADAVAQRLESKL